MTQVDDQVTRASFALGAGVSSERIEDKARELRALGGNLFGGVCINLLRQQLRLVQRAS